jgi:DNA end-binding protein Ku
MITIRHRMPGQQWREREFATNGEAETFAKGQPEDSEVSWGGHAETEDPPMATRSMWNGTIAFGMVSAPVKLFKATEDSTPGLHQFCAEHGQRMTFKRWCEGGDCGHELSSDQIVRGVETAGGPATLTDAELAELRAGTAKTIQVREFVPARSVPASYHDTTYYLAPEKGGRRPYDLLAAVLERSRCVAIAETTIRERTHLCMIRPEAGRLVLVTLHWYGEVRSDAGLPNLHEQAVVPAAELEMARTLVRSMRQPTFQPHRFQDPYATALAARLEAKVAAVEPEGEQPNVLDLMGKLEASVKGAKRRRSA